MSKETLKKWLNGEYVSPKEFKDSVQEAVKRIGILEKIYKSDVEYYMKEIERLQEERSQDGFKIIELQTAIKIKDQCIQNLGARLEKELDQQIEDYFKSVTNEQFLEDLRKANCLHLVEEVDE